MPTTRWIATKRFPDRRGRWYEEDEELPWFIGGQELDDLKAAGLITSVVPEVLGSSAATEAEPAADQSEEQRSADLAGVTLMEDVDEPPAEKPPPKTSLKSARRSRKKKGGQS